MDDPVELAVAAAIQPVTIRASSETTPEMVHPSQVHRLSKLDSPSEPQCTAFFTSAVILASSVAVNLVSAY